MSARWSLKRSSHSCFPGELTMLLVKKRICTIKDGSGGSTSNADLGLF